VRGELAARLLTPCPATMAMSVSPTGVIRLSFSKEKITVAPNNPSAWTYLRGILDYVRMPFSTQAAFTERLYVVDAVEESTDDDVLQVALGNLPPSGGAELPCVAAIEFVADIHKARGKDSGAKTVYSS